MHSVLGRPHWSSKSGEPFTRIQQAFRQPANKCGNDEFNTFPSTENASGTNPPCAEVASDSTVHSLSRIVYVVDKAEAEESGKFQEEKILTPKMSGLPAGIPRPDSPCRSNEHRSSTASGKGGTPATMPSSPSEASLSVRRAMPRALVWQNFFASRNHNPARSH